MQYLANMNLSLTLKSRVYNNNLLLLGWLIEWKNSICWIDLLKDQEQIPDANHLFENPKNFYIEL